MVQARAGLRNRRSFRNAPLAGGYTHDCLRFALSKARRTRAQGPLADHGSDVVDHAERIALLFGAGAAAREIVLRLSQEVLEFEIAAM
jgi:hypothetical protein